MFNFNNKSGQVLRAALCCGFLGASAGVSAGSQPYVGEISFNGWNFESVGTAQCDGRLLSISQYSALFALLGTNYGGDGQQTFRLPDLRGRLPMHFGQGPGLTNHQVGDQGGQESVALLLANIAHSHQATTSLTEVAAHANSNQATKAQAAGGVWATTGRNFSYNSSAPNVDLASGALTASATTRLSNTGRGQPQPVNILPPYTVMNCLIALEGIFPSQN